jgi:hypothetical protein
MQLCGIKDPTQRRWFIRYMVAMAIYPFFCIAAVAGFLLLHVHGALSWPLALLPALPIAAAVYSIGSFVAHEKDDFQRHVQVWSLLGGMGATLVLTTMWGFLENYAHFQHMDLFWVWVIFWAFTGIAFLVVKARYR